MSRILYWKAHHKFHNLCYRGLWNDDSSNTDDEHGTLQLISRVLTDCLVIIKQPDIHSRPMRGQAILLISLSLLLQVLFRGHSDRLVAGIHHMPHCFSGAWEDILQDQDLGLIQLIPQKSTTSMKYLPSTLWASLWKFHHRIGKGPACQHQHPMIAD